MEADLTAQDRRKAAGRVFYRLERAEDMAEHKKVRERTKAFKDMTPREKVEQIWAYYRLVLLAIALGLALIIYIIYKIVNPDPEILLNVALVNSLGAVQTEDGEEEDIFNKYLTENGYNPEEVTISVTSNLYLTEDGSGGQMDMATMQSLMARVAASDIDILAGDKYILDMFGPDGGFLEMETVLSEEQMEKYADDLYTAVDEETGEEYVCGLKLPEGNLLTEAGYYGTEVYMAIPVTANEEHIKMAKDVFVYLLGE